MFSFIVSFLYCLIVHLSQFSNVNIPGKVTMFSVLDTPWGHRISEKYQCLKPKGAIKSEPLRV